MVAQTSLWGGRFPSAPHCSPFLRSFERPLPGVLSVSRRAGDALHSGLAVIVFVVAGADAVSGGCQEHLPANPRAACCNMAFAAVTCVLGCYRSQVLRCGLAPICSLCAALKPDSKAVPPHGWGAKNARTRGTTRAWGLVPTQPNPTRVASTKWYSSEGGGLGSCFGAHSRTLP